MKKAIKLAVFMGMVLLAASILAQTADVTKSEESKTDKAADAAAATPSDYVIGADDTLHISVWKEPDLSETLPVRPDGKISMPLLNDVMAAGLTPLELKDSITEKLKKYIADPRVTVVVTAMNSRRIFVTGEVTHTGPMALLPHMTMLQALAEAGFTQFANLKAIYVLRTENGKQEKLPFNYKEVVKGDRPEQNIVLKPGDTVVASTEGRRIQLQPASVLRSHNALEQTVRHELFHAAVESRAAPGLPVWFREGIVEFLSSPEAGREAGPSPADSDIRETTDAARARRASGEAARAVAALVKRYGEATVLDWVARGLPPEVKNASTSQAPTKSK